MIQISYEEMCQILWDNENINKLSDLMKHVVKLGYTHADRNDIQMAFGWIRQFPSVINKRKIWYPIWSN